MTSQAQSHHSVLPLRLYLAVGAVLLIATAATVWASHFNVGPYNLVIAMFIAAAKATLVALYFMHLKYDNKLYMFIFTGGILFLAVFVVLTMFDTQRRDLIDKIEARPINAEAVIYRKPDTTPQAAGVPDTVTADSLPTAGSDTTRDTPAAEKK
jgi:cytochrome c oxidase subunit 4